MPITEVPTDLRLDPNSFQPEPPRTLSSSRRSDRIAPFAEGAHVLILAGGDGARLRSVTRVLAGDERPKQFCALVGGEPLLVQAARRAAMIAPPENLRLLLTRPHEPYFRDTVGSLDPSSLVIQPGNRGTATAVLYGLLRIAAGTPTTNCSVVILPSDHWISDEHAFGLYARVAVGVVEAHENVVVLLGTTPTRPETDYGWIEPAEPIIGGWRDLHRVSRFVEKPAADAARQLFQGTSLWNTSVVVGRLEELLFLFAIALPDLVDSFLEIWPALGTPSESDAADRLYARLPHADFSSDVLAKKPHALAVLAVNGLVWEDLGSPARVREARRLEQARHPAARSGMPAAS
jgi:mannose-1-phosphate guanylyltransferase